MDFFAMVGGTHNGVFRLEIDAQLQSHLTTAFNDQSQVLLGSDLEIVPFTRENFHPDETEVLEISPFDLPSQIYEPTINAVGCETLPADDATVSRIYCVFGYDKASDTIVFQVIRRAQRISRTCWNLILSGNTFSRLDQSGLILGDVCHAVYRSGNLRFRSIWWLKQIIDINAYYRVATESDIDDLAALSTVKVENLTTLKERSGEWVRTRIAYILDSKIFDACPPLQLSQKAAEFKVSLETIEENGQVKLLIPEDPKKLRAVLKFLEEEYYSGPITGVTYEANSKRRISPAGTGA